MSSQRITSAETVLPCLDLSKTLAFFTDKLGFRVDSIFPADAPRVAVISGYGTRLRLDSDASGDPGAVRLYAAGIAGQESLRAPNGTRVELVAADAPLQLPPNSPSLLVSRASEGASWGTGRAGMQYRDLIPGRYGGRFIASHIRIPDGGPVPDYVHHHHVHFQMIYCVHGWVRVVYEDQGPPMLMEAGDCFLQPPHIRHRVLECSEQMEVVEISCPAEHETRVDHEMQLPTAEIRPERDFGGQRFVFHKAREASWSGWYLDGFECSDTGIEAATDGVASAVVARVTGEVGSATLTHDAELRFLFVLNGRALLCCDDEERGYLDAGDSCAIPANLDCVLTGVSPDFRLLDVCIPSRRAGRSAR